MSAKVILSTSGLKQSRKRPVDVDHAQQVYDLTSRGYHVNVRDPNSMWSVSLFQHRSKDGTPVFVNLPDGVVHSLQFRPHLGTEDARTRDDYPEWINKLHRYLTQVRPTDVGFNNQEAADG